MLVDVVELLQERQQDASRIKGGPLELERLKQLYRDLDSIGKHRDVPSLVFPLAL